MSVCTYICTHIKMYVYIYLYVCVCVFVCIFISSKSRTFCINNSKCLRVSF